MTPKPFTPHPLQLSALLRGATELWLPIDLSEKNVLSAGQRKLGWTFNADMVRVGDVGAMVASLVGAKPDVVNQQISVPARHPDDSRIPWEDCGRERIYAPYQPGEVVACKEKYAPSVRSGMRQIMFASDGRWGSLAQGEGIFYPLGWVSGVTDKVLPDWQQREGHWVGRTYFGHWKAARTLPLWAVRLRLTITAVEARQVQSVTEDEAMYAGYLPELLHAGLGMYGTCKAQFSDDWDTIHGPDCWERNCWAWKYTVERTVKG